VTWTPSYQSCSWALLRFSSDVRLTPAACRRRTVSRSCHVHPRRNEGTYRLPQAVACDRRSNRPRRCLVAAQQCKKRQSAPSALRNCDRFHPERCGSLSAQAYHSAHRIAARTVIELSKHTVQRKTDHDNDHASDYFPVGGAASVPSGRPRQRTCNSAAPFRHPLLRLGLAHSGRKSPLHFPLLRDLGLVFPYA
jgi:hypothetical protein